MGGLEQLQPKQTSALRLEGEMDKMTDIKPLTVL